MTFRPGRLVPLAALLALLAQAPARAADVAVSGYGTIGYAQSDRDYAYQRHITEDGTFARDTVLGLQLDARFDHGLGATAQVKLGAAPNADNVTSASLAWAFLSWRPASDWLLRAGKLRMPIYLYSENMDVGATYDFARLPQEVYSTAPTTDFVGASAEKTWNLGDDELAATAFVGGTDIDYRFYLRDSNPPASSGARYQRMDVNAFGLVLNYRSGDDLWHLSAAHANARAAGAVTRYNFQPVAPGIGYWQTSPALPGPGMRYRDEIRSLVLTAGVEKHLGNDWRVVGEYARRVMRDDLSGPDSNGGYLALLRRVGNWTPYVSAAYLRSRGSVLDYYDTVNSTRLPTGVLPLPPEQVAAINTAQRNGADGIGAFDQRSIALGTSYAITPRNKLKAEWQYVRIGRVSALVDAPEGTDIRNTGINVFSLSYSFVF